MSTQSDTPLTFIGVKSLLSPPPLSKHDFLLFDQLVSPLLTGQFTAQLPPDERVLLDWLVEKELLTGVDQSVFDSYAGYLKDDGPVSSQLLLVLGLAALTILLSEYPEKKEKLRVFGPVVDEVLQYFLTHTATLVEVSRGVRSVPLFDRPTVFNIGGGGLRLHGNKILESLKSLPRRLRYQTLEEVLVPFSTLSVPLPEIRSVVAAEKLLLKYLDAPPERGHSAPAVEIVLNALPVPDDSVPWEQILEFKRDQQVSAYLLGLRKWMRNVSTKSADPKVIREELEDLLSEYKEYMRLQKMKTRLACWEAVLTAPGDIVGQLVRLNFGAAVRTLFKVRERQLAFQSVELAAPGREVAYVLYAREEFGT